MADLKILEVAAYPTSFPIPEKNRLTLGIGRVVKRDAMVVKVTTDGGIVGWGESHHARYPRTFTRVRLAKDLQRSDIDHHVVLGSRTAD